MKRGLLIFVTVIMLLLFVTLSACGNGKENQPAQENLSLEYSQEYVRTKELCGSGWLINKTLDVTTYQNNKYYFDESVDGNVRNDFVVNQKEICEVLRDNNIIAENISFYIINGIDNYAVSSENSVYIDISKSGLAEQVELALEVLLGEYTNYGYIYALSQHICTQLSWQNEANVEIDINVLKNDPYLLNLSYPCFSEDYATDIEISMVKGVAMKALSQMTDAFSGESEFEASVQKYADDNSLDFYKTYLSFAYGGKNCPLKIKTRYLDIYLDSDYEGSCILTEQSVLDDPMFNFDKMIEFWEYADEDMSAVREKLGYSGEYMIPVYVQDINMSFTDGSSYAGLFQQVSDGCEILLENIYVITHEYTHFLDYSTDKSNSDDENWCGEVLACYYGKNMAYLDRVVRANSGYDDVLSIDDLSRLIGGKPYQSVDDEILFQNVMTAYTEKPKKSVVWEYGGRLSFGVYFVETYGEQTFIDCMLTPSSTTSLIGKSLDEIIDDWCLWLEQFKILDW